MRTGLLADVPLYDKSTNWATIAVGRPMDTHHTVEEILVTKTRHTPECFRHHNDLLSLLARFCRQLATDPRDKIYSLLGMVEPNSHNSLRVDYTLTWTEVFRDAAIYVIGDRNDLEVLMYAGSSETELPSWVPDWLD